jgi:hypothetical protein
MSCIEYQGDKINRVNDEIMKSYPNSIQQYDIDTIKWGGTSTIRATIRELPIYLNNKYIIRAKNENTFEYLIEKIENVKDIEDAEAWLYDNFQIESLEYIEGTNKISFAKEFYPVVVEGDEEKFLSILDEVGMFTVIPLNKSYKEFYQDFVIVIDKDNKILDYQEIYEKTLKEICDN